MHANPSGLAIVEHDGQATELVNYGAGYAWLRPDDEPRYVLTDQGRRELALERLLGPWPTVAEAFGIAVGQR